MIHDGLSAAPINWSHHSGFINKSGCCDQVDQASLDPLRQLGAIGRQHDPWRIRSLRATKSLEL